MALVDDVYRFSTEEYDRMVDAGVLDGTRVQLLDGLLIEMQGQGEEHVWITQRLTVMLATYGLAVRVQAPLAVADGWLPEPDVAVTIGHVSYAEHPTAAAFVAEVSVSSQGHDRRKARVYAAAGVPVYWMIDVPEERVIVHTEPSERGYAVSSVLIGTDVLDCGLPDATAITVADLFPWSRG